MSERVLVAGASGFLGRHLVTRLAAEGARVTGVDIEAPDGVLPCEFHQCRVEDYLAALGTRHVFDTIFHFAAIVGGRTVIEGSPMHVARNIEVDRLVFDYVSSVGSTRLVYPSSSAVYPVHLQEGRPPRVLQVSDVDLDANFLGMPDSTYGWAKLTGELSAQITRKRTQAPIVVYRPFSVYGPGQAEDYPVTAIARRVLALEDPLVVWGSGQQTRDFVHISDFLRIVLGTYRVLDGSEPVNIATGLPVSFIQLARTLAQTRGYNPIIEPRIEMPAGVAYRVGSPRSIPDHLLPTMPLDKGLLSVLEWLSE